MQEWLTIKHYCINPVKSRLCSRVTLRWQTSRGPSREWMRENERENCNKWTTSKETWSASGVPTNLLLCPYFYYEKRCSSPVCRFVFFFLSLNSMNQTNRKTQKARERETTFKWNRVTTRLPFQSNRKQFKRKEWPTHERIEGENTEKNNTRERVFVSILRYVTFILLCHFIRIIQSHIEYCSVCTFTPIVVYHVLRKRREEHIGNIFGALCFLRCSSFCSFWFLNTSKCKRIYFSKSLVLTVFCLFSWLTVLVSLQCFNSMLFFSLKVLPSNFSLQEPWEIKIISLKTRLPFVILFHVHVLGSSLRHWQLLDSSSFC